METIRISRLSGQEAKKNVQVEALVSSMEEAMTSNGKPYVKGVLSDRRDKVSFKVWDTTLADLTRSMGCQRGKPSLAVFREILTFTRASLSSCARAGLPS